MAKYYGKIGFVTFVESSPGVHTESIVEKDYTGDIFQERRTVSPSTGVNDGLSLSARVGIVADSFALSNVAALRYVTWKGVKWEISQFEITHPRIILSLGGVYNG